MKLIGVPNYQAYKVTEHAQERALTRFNIPKGELDTWMSRLLSNGSMTVPKIMGGLNGIGIQLFL